MKGRGEKGLYSYGTLSFNTILADSFFPIPIEIYTLGYKVQTDQIS